MCLALRASRALRDSVLDENHAVAALACTGERQYKMHLNHTRLALQVLF